MFALLCILSFYLLYIVHGYKEWMYFNSYVRVLLLLCAMIYSFVLCLFLSQVCKARAIMFF